MEKWRNKVAVVSGASSGIGAACCKALIENGTIVVGLARRQNLIEQLRDQWPGQEEKQNRLHAYKCDVTDEAEVCAVFEQIAKQFGNISILINNAGITRDTELLRENNGDDLRAVMDTNVMGVAYCTREAFRHMSKNTNDLAHVVIINSCASHKVLNPQHLLLNIYPASKYAITAMTEVYRQEFLLYQKNVKITSISPGIVRTNIFLKNFLQHMNDTPYLEPSDIADAVMFCLQTPPHVQIHDMIIKPVGEKF